MNVYFAYLNGADQVRFLEAQNQVLLSMSTRVGVRIKVLILRSPESYIFFFLFYFVLVPQSTLAKNESGI